MTTRTRPPWAVWHRRPRGTPSVVFVDDSHWVAFTQLSPLLRRKGVRTIRVTTEVRIASRLVSSLLFDRHAVVPPGNLVETLRKVLGSENVVDVQFVEALSASIGDALGSMGCGIVHGVEVRLAAMDKISLSRRLDASGIRVPAILPMPGVSPETVARILGFPVVLKARVGSSGDQIRIVHDLPALHRVAATWGEHPERYFCEQYVDGEKYNYGAAVGECGIEQELTYWVSAWRQPTGSASQIETVADGQLAALGRRALEVVGCTGLVNIDVIRDREGVDWLIDFNARAFGGAASFLCAGLDISEGERVPAVRDRGALLAFTRNSKLRRGAEDHLPAPELGVRNPTSHGFERGTPLNASRSRQPRNGGIRRHCRLSPNQRVEPAMPLVHQRCDAVVRRLPRS